MDHDRSTTFLHLLIDILGFVGIVLISVGVVSFGAVNPLHFSRLFIMVYYMERCATNLIALRSLWLA